MTDTYRPAGWYPDPEDSSRERWWGGTGWLDTNRPKTDTSPSFPLTTPATLPPTTPATLPIAGWYPNPENPNEKRYWDGTAWTDDIEDVLSTLPPPRPIPPPPGMPALSKKELLFPPITLNSFKPVGYQKGWSVFPLWGNLILVPTMILGPFLKIIPFFISIPLIIAEFIGITITANVLRVRAKRKSISPVTESNRSAPD